jgi:hypothetical protein
MPNNEAEMHLQSTFDPDALPIYPRNLAINILDLCLKPLSYELIYLSPTTSARIDG